MDYGKVLTTEAERKNLELEEVAFKAKVSRNTVVSVLAGSDRVNLTSVQKVAQALGFAVVDVEVQPQEKR